MTEAEKLLELVCQDQLNWELRLILADAYEETGQQSNADCQRWMVKNQKHPSYETWFNEDTVITRYQPQSNLPDRIFKLLHGKDVRWWKEFDSPRQAEEEIMRIFPIAFGQNPTETVNGGSNARDRNHDSHTLG
jgi:hypothetical protein